MFTYKNTKQLYFLFITISIFPILINGLIDSEDCSINEIAMMTYKDLITEQNEIYQVIIMFLRIILVLSLFLSILQILTKWENPLIIISKLWDIKKFEKNKH